MLADVVVELHDMPTVGRPHNERGAPLTEDSVEWLQHQQYVLSVMDHLLSDAQTFPFRGDWGTSTQGYFKEKVTAALDKVSRVPAQRRAVVLGGLPGAGKTTTVRRCGGVFADAKFADVNAWATVNADSFKEMIVDCGDAPAVRGLSPMETSFLTHELSSEMAHMFGRALMAAGQNIILDTTMGGDTNPVALEIAALQKFGYTIDAVYVDTPFELAESRQRKRWLDGLNAYRRGENNCGGRAVPLDVNRRSRNQNRENFNQLVDSGVFGRWCVVNNVINEDTIVDGGRGSERFPDIRGAVQIPSNIPGVY